MLPAAETMFASRPWICQHDNDLKHTARSVKQWVDDQNFQSLQLPDFNPIEHLWQEVDSSVKNSRPSNKELFRVVNDAWLNITSSHVCYC